MPVVLLASPIVRMPPKVVAPAPVSESIVLSAAIENVPAFATPELAAIVPVAFKASVPVVTVVAPV